MTKQFYTVVHNVRTDKWEVKQVGTDIVYNTHRNEFDAVDEAAVLNMVTQLEEDDDIYNERHDFTY